MSDGDVEPWARPSCDHERYIETCRECRARAVRTRTPLRLPACIAARQHQLIYQGMGLCCLTEPPSRDEQRTAERIAKRTYRGN